MQAVITKTLPGDAIESCGIEGCPKAVAYHLVKVRDDNSEEETFFCEPHGDEYVTRGHLGVAESV
jgi:hypothetical protein